MTVTTSTGVLIVVNAAAGLWSVPKLRLGASDVA